MNQFTYYLQFTASSCSSAEIHLYTALFSFGGILGAIVAPLLGRITDTIVNRAKKISEIKESELKILEIKAHFLPLLITSVCSILMYGSLLIFNSASIYFSMLALTICRSCTFSTSTAFLRSRFPVEHLDRLMGIYNTIISILMIVAYPQFIWSTVHYYSAITFALVLIIFNLSYPLHLHYDKGIRNAVLQKKSIMLDRTWIHSSSRPI